MAKKKSTVALGIATYKAADEALADLGNAARMARALADSLKVLAALERTTSHTEPDGMKTGHAYASGHAVADDTMPDVASHLVELLDQIQRHHRALFEAFERDFVAAEAVNG